MKIPAALTCVFIWAFALGTAFPDEVSANLRVDFGAVNTVTVGDGVVSVYRASLSNKEPGTGSLLLTHARRDVVGTPPKAVKIFAPEAEREQFESPGKLWADFTKGRFHDYAQQSTKLLAEPIMVSRWVGGGASIDLGGYKVDVVDTPGYTRGSVSYLATIDGSRVAFTGDLIYGDGKVADLYSFQDAIPEANIGGYHGYGGRLAALIESLGKIKAEKPDLIVPARGPIIEKPDEAIDKLIDRVKRLYQNYLSTSALNWYFKEERMRTCGKRILGNGADIQLMGYATHVDTPDWIFTNSTSRLLISDDGFGFLLDCGGQRVIDSVKDLMERGLVKKVEGIFVTHFHDDHTDMVQAAAEVFDCPVYATTEYADVLENPAAYHLPAMTSNPIKNIRAKNDGETMQWREFDMTFHFYPGQAFYHGGLFVRKAGETPIFFIGDSFSPSGIDDYCVQNRNLVHEDTGYGLCFSKLRAIKEDYWIVNEHIPHLFRFSDRELTYLETRYGERAGILRELFPWDDPNYGIDEQWAVFYPYGAKIARGQERSFEIRLENHSPVEREFKVKPKGWNGLKVLTGPVTIKLKPRQTGKVTVKVRAPDAGGHCLVTADVVSEGMAFTDWIEALVTLE
jgi:glyoxylase-like metal-dependent hydrolase (beta-lactamase superfamily II)